MATHSPHPASLAERALQRSYPRQEPSALDAHAGICAGGRQQRRSLPRLAHAGSALLAQVADKLGLTRALSLRLAGLKQRRRGHDPVRVIRDLAVMLADGGESVSDLGAVRALFGPVASEATAFRTVERIASEPGLLDALRAAHAWAREWFWELHGAPERLTIDPDATLITAHCEKENAAGKGGFGFHPLQAYADRTREALGALLRPGNAGANTADHKMVLDLALGQIPGQYVESLEILVRADSAGATHELADHCYVGNMRFSFGYELTEAVRNAILETPQMLGLWRSTRKALSGRTARLPRSSGQEGRSTPSGGFPG
jgi:Transposase DDE domain group 1